MNDPVPGQAWARSAGGRGESERPRGVGPEEGSGPELPSEVAALRRVRFFEELTDADLSRLARIGQRRSYAAGDAIVERDSDQGGFFVLLSGEAEVEAGGTSHVLSSGDFFGETALLAGSRRTATVRATEPVQAMVFEAIYFRPFLIENPSVAVTLLEVLADRLNAAQARLEGRSSVDMTFEGSEAAEAAEELGLVGEPERSLHVDPRSVEANTRSSRMPNAGNKRARRLAMMDDTDPIESPQRTIRGQVQPRRVERLLIVRPQDDADAEAARSELEDLPGVVGVTLNTVTRSFDIAFDSAVVSDDELGAALHHHGYDLISWQEVIHAAQQRTWLLEQIQVLAPRAELELAERGTYANGVMKGSVDAYVRAARAFGLVTDAEIIQLIPARFFKGPD